MDNLLLPVICSSGISAYRPRSIYQYSNMARRLSGQTSIFGVVFFVSKSLLGIERQKKLEKFAILTREPRSHAWILIYRTWPIEQISFNTSSGCYHTLELCDICSIGWSADENIKAFLILFLVTFTIVQLNGHETLLRFFFRNIIISLSYLGNFYLKYYTGYSDKHDKKPHVGKQNYLTWRFVCFDIHLQKWPFIIRVTTKF